MTVTKRSSPAAIAALVSLVLAFVGYGLSTSGATPSPATPPALVAASAAADDGWRSLVANIYEGTELYLKSDDALIGTVIEIRDEATFEDGTKGKGVRIRFKDGSRMWIPRATAQMLYKTKASR